MKIGSVARDDYLIGRKPSAPPTASAHSIGSRANAKMWSARRVCSPQTVAVPSLFQVAFKMRLRRAGICASGEAARDGGQLLSVLTRARRISAAICNERATKPEAQITRELSSS
jgi:hypothetical protein